MIRAKGTIIVGNKEYQEGQTVCGLSEADVRWMKEKGFVEEVDDTKKPLKHAKKGEKAEDDVSGDVEGGS